jgi:hypothetical protein
MKRTKATIEKCITALLKPHGFTKHGTVWSVARGDAVLGVWLQASRYARAAYLNFVAWYPALSDRQLRSMPAGDFHVSFRADSAKRDEVWSLLQFDEAEIDLDQYRTELDRLFFGDCLERLLTLSSLEVAVDHCRRDDRTMSYSIEVVEASKTTKST